MSVTFVEALKNELNKSSRLKLLNGEILHGTIQSVTAHMVQVKMDDKGAGSPTYTIPFSSILYFSDCELPNPFEKS